MNEIRKKNPNQTPKQIQINQQQTPNKEKTYIK